MALIDVDLGVGLWLLVVIGMFIEVEIIQRPSIKLNPLFQPSMWSNDTKSVKSDLALAIGGVVKCFRIYAVKIKFKASLASPLCHVRIPASIDVQ